LAKFSAGQGKLWLQKLRQIPTDKVMIATSSWRAEGESSHFTKAKGALQTDWAHENRSQFKTNVHMYMYIMPYSALG
jgi:hypothetical protein